MVPCATVSEAPAFDCFEVFEERNATKVVATAIVAAVAKATASS